MMGSKDVVMLEEIFDSLLSSIQTQLAIDIEYLTLPLTV
jgi:hypothetical protein